MANNYVLFSTEFPFPKQAADDFAALCGGEVPKWFLARHAVDSVSDAGDVIAANDAEYLGIDVRYDENAGKLFISSEESGNVEGTAWLLSEVMAHYGLKEPVVIEVAYTCDKMRPGEFGGCVLVVGPGMVEGMDTRLAGMQLADKMKNKLATKE